VTPAFSTGSSADASDAEAVATLLGRAPFTQYTVAVRCPFGGPAVLENEPIDLNGRPFPTRYWLSCRALSVAVSRGESVGGVRMLEDDASMRTALKGAHLRHQKIHAGYRVGGGGDPNRVKCLHAHLAFGLAEGGSPVSRWISERFDAVWPETCCLAGRATP
jgi:uncharacterized protein